jgi:hypothetical protein
MLLTFADGNGQRPAANLPHMSEQRTKELWLQKDCQKASWVNDGGMLASGNAVMKCVTESDEHE